MNIEHTGMRNYYYELLFITIHMNSLCSAAFGCRSQRNSEARMAELGLNLDGAAMFPLAMVSDQSW
jgi:hypothetical protein